MNPNLEVAFRQMDLESLVGLYLSSLGHHSAFGIEDHGIPSLQNRGRVQGIELRLKPRQRGLRDVPASRFRRVKPGTQGLPSQDLQLERLPRASQGLRQEIQALLGSLPTAAHKML